MLRTRKAAFSHRNISFPILSVAISVAHAPEHTHSLMREFVKIVSVGSWAAGP